MLSQVLVGAAIILMGVILGMAFDAIPPVGGKGDWVCFWVTGPAMVVCCGILAWTLGVAA